MFMIIGLSLFFFGSASAYDEGSYVMVYHSENDNFMAYFVPRNDIKKMLEYATPLPKKVPEIIFRGCIEKYKEDSNDR